MFQLHLQGLVRKCNTFCIYISSVCVSLHNLSVSLLTMEPYTIWKVSTIKDHLWTDMVFPVVTYICESWTIKKAVSQRVDAFELWCWRRLLRAPWTAGRSNQSVLREINTEYSFEGLMLKLKLQHFGHLMKLIRKVPDAMID